ncbi:MAG: radical SAM protein [Desulfovibrionaceae bacterium]|nr:radical SAM protein [Desulfovibrionaceae bacterium]
MAFSSNKDDILVRAAAAMPSGISRLLSSLTGARRPLSHIQVEVTSFCPGACVYCPRGILGRSWKAKTMSDATFAELAPLMQKAARVHLQGWGEPYLHPRLLDYVALARKAGCQASTTSCGLCMTEELARGTVLSGMDIVAFSLAGTDEASNAARKNVPMDRVERAVGMLNRAKKELGRATPRIHLSYLLLADREEALDGLPGLMEKWDVPVCVVSTLDMPVLPSHWDWAYRPEERAKIARARARLERIAAAAAASGRSVRYCLPGAETGNCREDVEHSCYVDADGRLAPCIYLNAPFTAEQLAPHLAADKAAGSEAAMRLSRMHRVVEGNIQEENPVQIWEKSGYHDFRADLAHGVTPDCCLSCPKRFEHMY